MANVRVAVRVRPLSQREADTGARNIITTHGNSLSITNVKVEGTAEFGDSREKVKHFAFDYCYDSNIDLSTANTDFASQELVYQDLGTEVLQAAFDGYNACLFAYGQTGTGKTFTMMGYPGEVGLTPRICEGLFSHVDDCPEESITFRVEISYLEIYNERVRDLLRTSQHPERFTLRVREHPKDGPYVQDLSRHQVKDYHEIQTLLDRGNQYRTTAATHMHEHSSRSHAIVTVNFTQAKMEDGMPSETVSKVHLVDLAGSERADPNYHANYKGRITEGANINKSLYTLGYVIKGLAEKSLLAWSSEASGSHQNVGNSGESQSGGRKARPLYIPYRDSVLTWLLKDSLGGNSKTLMIATITPASQYYSETISTLRYAQRAKSIVNQPRINEDANVSLIRQLRQEIERLKQMLASARLSHSSQLNEILYFLPGADRFLTYNQSDIESDEGGAMVAENYSGAVLSEKLKENEAMANQLTQSWLNKWSETQTLMQDTDLSIRGLGRRSSSYGVIIDSQLPHLIGMDDDILSTGVIIFHLKEGKTTIGREDARREQDIVLDGPGIQSEHCHVKNEDGQVTLYPHHGAPCSVNGVLIHEPTSLTQGDVLLLGKTSMYRFNHPAQAAKLRQRRQSLQDGEMSAASSVASLTEPEVTRAAPLRLFNPNVELEHAFANEEERIQHARGELERVREELSVREEAGQEEEESLWTEHEKHREELEAEKIRLAHLKDRLLRLEQQAHDTLCLQREQLDDKDRAYQRHLEQQLGEITSQGKGGDSIGQQTEDLEVASSSIQTDEAASTRDTASAAIGVSDAVITGDVGQDIRRRKLSVEGRVKGLAQSELLHGFRRRQALQDLQSREEKMEEEILQSREEVESRVLKIQQKEEQYRDADASRLDRLRQQKEQVEELQRQEEQLELYLEEKQDLLAVGQAQPRPLRGAHSELFLAPAGTTTEILCPPTARATSETNIGECVDSGMDLMPSDSNMSDSRESLDDAGPGMTRSVAFHPDSSISFDQSQSFEYPESESVERPRSDLSQSLGSEMDSEELLPESKGFVEDSDPSALPPASRAGEGRGRSRVRSGRGKPRTLQSQGQGKPEALEEKKLTSRAQEVTARLYQPKTARGDPQEKLLGSGRDRQVTSHSHSPSSRSSPSPQPSSTSQSPRSPAHSKRGAFHYSPEAGQKKSRSREDWDRPWRTRPETLTRSRKEDEQQSVPHRSLDKNRENWDRPWRQGRPPADGSKPSRALPHTRSPTATKKGATPLEADTDRASPRAATRTRSGRGDKGVTGRDGRMATARSVKEANPSSKAASSSPRRSAAGSPSFPADGSGDSGPASRKIRSGDVSAKDTETTWDRAKDSASGSPLSRSGSDDSVLAARSRSPQPRKQRLGGSDSSLSANTQRQLPYRPCSRLRQISSASSLPSVPEAAAESDTDLDSAPLTSVPNMAALVAAVPRRQRRGRRDVREEEERRHSEPVGDKLAQALAEYTAEMESSMGQDGLRRQDLLSVGTIPQICLTEATSSGTEGSSSQESVQHEDADHTPESPGDQDMADRPSEDSNSQRKAGTSGAGAVHPSKDGSQKGAGAADLPAAKAGDKRDHQVSGERRSPVEVAPKKRKSADQSEDSAVESGQLTSAMDTADHSEDSVTTESAVSRRPQVPVTSRHEDVADVGDRDSEGSYTPDSLDDGEGAGDTAMGDVYSSAAHRQSSEQEGVFQQTRFTVPNVGTVELGYHTGEHVQGAGGFTLHGHRTETNVSDVAETRDAVNVSKLERQTSSTHDDVYTSGAVSPAERGLHSQSSESCDERHGDTTKSSADTTKVSQTLKWRWKGSDSAGLDSTVSTSGLKTEAEECRIDTGVEPTSAGSKDALTATSAVNTNTLSSDGSGEASSSQTESRQRSQDSSTSTATEQTSHGTGRGSGPECSTTDQSTQCSERQEMVDRGMVPRESRDEEIANRDDPLVLKAEVTTGDDPSMMKTEMAKGDIVVGHQDEADVTGGGGGDVGASSGEVPVTMEMLTMLAKEEEGSQLSDETSSSHVEKQIQAWQEVLQQLSPRLPVTAPTGVNTNTSGSAHAANGRRGKRRQHSRHVKDSDSEDAEHFSDDSLASGANSRSSSRPSSGCRRRRRPASKATETAVKRRRAHSSEEYVSSDNNSIFSDDSLTHSSERHETASQISDLRSSIQQLTAGLEDSETLTAVTPTQPLTQQAMEGADHKSVPTLVSYFESQMKRPPDNRESSPRGDAWRTERGSSAGSLPCDDGHMSASEGTQTEGSSVVMGKAPVSVLSAGDPNYVVSNGVLQSLSGTQNIQEVSSVQSQSRRSWKLSISPTITWHTSTDPQTPRAEVEEERSDRVQLRRRSKADISVNCPEKRQRQDKLTDLHSKYGLMDEVDHMSDEDDLQGTATAVSGQTPSPADPVQYQSHLQKKRHTAKMDSDGKLLLEVTINQDETNVLYNVETTEYKTYALKDNGGTASQEASGNYIPDSININLTETTTLQRDDRFATVTKERVIFDSKDPETSSNDEVLMERKFTRGHMLEFEQGSGRESSVERNLTDEESSSSLKLKSSQDSLVIDSQRTSSSALSQNTAEARAHSVMPSQSAVSGSFPSAGAHQSVKHDGDSPGNAVSKDTVKDPRMMLRRDGKRGGSVDRPPMDSSSSPGQVHQAEVIHGGLSEQGHTVPVHNVRTPGTANITREGQVKASHPVMSHLQVETSLPDTPPPVKTSPQASYGDAALHHHRSSLQRLPDGRLVLPVSVGRSGEGTGPAGRGGAEVQRGQTVVQDGGVHQRAGHSEYTDQVDMTDGYSEGVRFFGADTWHNADQKDNEKTMTADRRLQVEVSQQGHEQRSPDRMPANREHPGAVPHAGRQNSVNRSAVDAFEQRSRTQIAGPAVGTSGAATGDFYVSVRQPLGRTGSADKTARKGTTSGGDFRSAGIPSGDSDVTSNFGPQQANQPGEQNRPSVEEIPLEGVERLPHTPVHHGSQSALVYPYCHDGLLLYSSSSCSEEPFSWVETFVEETGIESSVTSPDRRGRLTSEETAKTLLAEIKQRSRDSHSEEDDQVFTGENVAMNRQLSAVHEGQDERGQEDTDRSDPVSSSHSSADQGTQIVSYSVILTADNEGAAHDRVSGHPGIPRPRGDNRQTGAVSAVQSHTERSSYPQPLSSMSSDSTSSSPQAQEESFHSSGNMVQSSSESSVCRTPQQSPRPPSTGPTPGSESQFPSAAAAVASAILASAGHVVPKAQTSPSPPRPGGEDTAGDGGVLVKAEPHVLTAVAAVVERQLVGGDSAEGVEAIREVLKQEVERKIATLQRRVRSLSDSAISSDFTEPESASVSPRNSRIPVCDVKMDSLLPGLGYSSPPAMQGLQQVFFARTEGQRSRQWSEGKPEVQVNEKSLADSGNIHDDLWQDPDEEKGDGPVQRKVRGNNQGEGKSSLGAGHTAGHLHTPSTPRLTVSDPAEARGDRLQQGRGSDTNSSVMSQKVYSSSSATSAGGANYGGTGSPRPATTSRAEQLSFPAQPEVQQLADSFSQQVKDALLSVQQSWPSTAFQSRSHLRRKRKGFVGRRSKSLNSLTELAAARECSNLERSLMEQARVLMQAARASGGVSVVSGDSSVGKESTYTKETENRASSHSPVTGGMAKGLPVSTERRSPGQGLGQDTTRGSLEEGHHASTALSSASEQAVRHILKVTAPGSGVRQTQSRESRGGDLSQVGSKQRKTCDAEDIPVQVGGRTDNPRGRSSHLGSDEVTSDEGLLTAGELEVAAINAVRNIRADVDTECRALSPGEEILADILARQWGVTSPFMTGDVSSADSPKPLDQLRIRGASPVRRAQPRRESYPSAEELSLSKETLHLLQQSCLEEQEAAQGLSLSGSVDSLDCERLSAGQLRMLQCKCVSTSNLHRARYTSAEEDLDLLMPQMERPASLACLEGLVLEDTSEDNDGSDDSICFVFMGHRGRDPEAQFSMLGDSIATSEGSERLAVHSRSTDSLPFEREVRVPPFSEHSASLDDICAASGSIQRQAQLHRSRSASLLDVTATVVNSNDEHEHIFPPHVCSGSEASLEGGYSEEEVSETSSALHPGYREVCGEVSTITNPAFIHRPSLVEPSAEQHLYLTSPTQLYTSCPPGSVRAETERRDEDSADLYQFTEDDSNPLSAPDVIEVESGQPYFRYRAPGARPQQSERGAQTERGCGPGQSSHSVSAVQTDLYQEYSTPPPPRSQDTAANRKVLVVEASSASDGGRLENRDRQGRLPVSSRPSEPQTVLTGPHPLSVPQEVCETAATQTEPLKTSVLGHGRVRTGRQHVEDSGHRVETGTQTPPFSPRVLYSGYPGHHVSLEPHTVVIKVKDTLTQTGSSLRDLSTTEVQTDSDMSDGQSTGSAEASLRPSVRHAASSMEDIVHYGMSPQVVHRRDKAGAGRSSQRTAPHSRQVSVCTQMYTGSHLITVRDAGDTTHTVRNSGSEASVHSAHERGSLRESVDSKGSDEDIAREQYIIISEAPTAHRIPDQFDAYSPKHPSATIPSSAAGIQGGLRADDVVHRHPEFAQRTAPEDEDTDQSPSPHQRGPPSALYQPSPGQDQFQQEVSGWRMPSTKEVLPHEELDSLGVLQEQGRITSPSYLSAESHSEAPYYEKDSLAGHQITSDMSAEHLQQARHPSAETVTVSHRDDSVREPKASGRTDQTKMEIQEQQRESRPASVDDRVLVKSNPDTLSSASLQEQTSLFLSAAHQREKAELSSPSELGARSSQTVDPAAREMSHVAHQGVPEGSTEVSPPQPRPAETLATPRSVIEEYVLSSLSYQSSLTKVKQRLREDSSVELSENSSDEKLRTTADDRQLLDKLTSVSQQLRDGVELSARLTLSEQVCARDQESRQHDTEQPDLTATSSVDTGTMFVSPRTHSDFTDEMSVHVGQPGPEEQDVCPENLKTGGPQAGDRSGEGAESSLKREETVEEIREVLHADSTMPLESGPVLVAPQPALPHTEEASSEVSPGSEPTVGGPDNRPKSRKMWRRHRGVGGELSYRSNEKVELSRAQVMRPRQWTDIYHDTSFSDDDMFFSDAQQRAAWRARSGDFGLPTAPVTASVSRLRAPDSARRHEDRLQASSVASPRQTDLSGDLEKLRQEHTRMMQLLERSRSHTSPLLSQLLRTRSASPRMSHTGSGSSSGESFVTVIAGRGAAGESPDAATASPRMPAHNEEESGTDPTESQGTEVTDHSGMMERRAGNPSRLCNTSSPQTDLPGRLVGTPSSTGTSSAAVLETGEGSVRAQTETSAAGTADHQQEVSAAHDQNNEDFVKEDAASRVPALTLSDLSPRSDQNETTLNSSGTAMSPITPRMKENCSSRWQGVEISRPPLDARHLSPTSASHPANSSARLQHVEASTVDSPRSELQQQQQRGGHAASNAGTPTVPYFPYGSDTEPSDVLLKTPRSLGGDSVPPMGHSLLPPSFISTGVEATVDSSDDFTQTDGEEENNLRLSQLDTSRWSAASSGTSETRRIRAELDRLQQERVEIIELLSLQYLPASLTVELLEAKLNYCLGQTDMLLVSLEKAWFCEETSDEWKQSRSKRHEEFLAEYRQQFEQSRQDLKVCMEEARRIHSGARGRRKARTRDVLAMRRRAQIEAFKEERRREQALFDRHRNLSPDQSDFSSSTSQGPSDPESKFAPRFLTPRQRKEYLVRLRRSVVEASSEELNELRQRSRSSSISRSPTPDLSISPASSRSNINPSRDSSLGSSVSPERCAPPNLFPNTASPMVSSGLSAPATYGYPGRSPSDSPRRIPRLVLPTEDLGYYRRHSMPSRSQSFMEPRSNSCGAALPPRQPFDPSHLAPEDVHSLSFQGFPSSYDSVSLDPEQLLRESYEARQLNRQQISKAQEALRLLEEHRQSFRSHISSARDVRHPRPGARRVASTPGTPRVTFSDQAMLHEEDSLHRQLTTGSSPGLDSAGLLVPLQDSAVSPKYTSTPRSGSSFAAYAKDVLARSERHIHAVIAQSSVHDLPDQDLCTQRSDLSVSDTPSSLQSTDLDSFLDSSSASGTRSTPRFTMSRPISSQDIKARIARRMKEKSKGKN